jgi:hypothetical protein
MSKTPLSFIILLTAILSCHLQPGKPRLSFDSQIINIGNMRSGTTYSGRFVLRNTGTGILQIDDVTTDCACTVADAAGKHILPGDSINVTFKVHPNLMGLFQQKIILKNNTDSSNPAMFVIRGNIVL